MGTRRVSCTSATIAAISILKRRTSSSRESRGPLDLWEIKTKDFGQAVRLHAATGMVNEFKSMVKRLHSAGLEVILDVVYNHSAEGNHLGPTLSFRGIDNIAYYRLMAETPRLYLDFTGTGNTFNLLHPSTLQL